MFILICSEYSMQLNASRIKFLQAQDDIISGMKEAASKELIRVSDANNAYSYKKLLQAFSDDKTSSNYKRLLQALIVQVLFLFYATNVVITCIYATNCCCI